MNLHRLINLYTSLVGTCNFLLWLPFQIKFLNVPRFFETPMLWYHRCSSMTQKFDIHIQDCNNVIFPTLIQYKCVFRSSFSILFCESITVSLSLAYIIKYFFELNINFIINCFKIKNILHFFTEVPG